MPGLPAAADLAAVVLAAGRGTRLRPLTDLLPKALCPVADVPLVDRALDRVAALAGRPADPSWVAVNAHHLVDLLAAHVGERVHLSVERPEALGTAGALGALRPWLDGRPVLVTNADAYLDADLGALVAGWDGERIRLAVVADHDRPDFAGAWRYAGVALMPWADVRERKPVPSGLYEVSWDAAERAGRLDLVPIAGTFVDCGTPPDYLRANLHASGGESVVGKGATVEGELVRSVVWPGGRVARGERLVERIRAGATLTVPAPQAPP
ncbi:MAG: NTP transferase domain-containing protein [Frankiaceae bacterium]